MSRYASSIEAASTTEDTERKTATMALETALYASKSGLMKVASGASRRAWVDEIPDRTPTARAS